MSAVDSTGMVESPAQHDTSLAAAVEIAPVASKLRLFVLQTIAARGQHGLTDEEGIRETGIAANTYRPRRVELDRGWRELEGGFVIDSGQRRVTASGRTAAVWVVTDLGRELLNTSPIRAGEAGKTLPPLPEGSGRYARPSVTALSGGDVLSGAGADGSLSPVVSGAGAAQLSLAGSEFRRREP